MIRLTHGTPSSEQIAFAQQVSDLMKNELVAALFREFNETIPDNVEQGKQAISLIFNDANRDMRLVGTFAPLLGGDDDLPSDSFEQTALNLALQGQAYTAVESVGGTFYYRRSIPLSNTFHQAGVLCHTNFTDHFFKKTDNPPRWTSQIRPYADRPKTGHRACAQDPGCVVARSFLKEQGA